MENTRTNLGWKLVVFCFNLFGLSLTPTKKCTYALRAWFVLIIILYFVTHIAVVTVLKHLTSFNFQSLIQVALAFVRDLMAICLVTKTLLCKSNLIEQCDRVLNKLNNGNRRRDKLLSSMLVLLAVIQLLYFIANLVYYWEKSALEERLTMLFLSYASCMKGLPGIYAAVVAILFPWLLGYFIVYLHQMLLILTVDAVRKQVNELATSVENGIETVRQIAQKHTELYLTVRKLNFYVRWWVFVWMVEWVGWFCMKLAVYICLGSSLDSLILMLTIMEIVPAILVLIIMLFIFSLMFETKDQLLSACHKRPKPVELHLQLEETFLLNKINTARLHFDFMGMAILDKSSLHALLSGALTYLLFMLAVVQEPTQTGDQNCESVSRHLLSVLKSTNTCDIPYDWFKNSTFGGYCT